MSAAEHCYLAVDGIRYHYLKLGSGIPVLMLHGFPENCWSYSKNQQALVDAGFQVIVPDLKGYGLTTKPLPGQEFGDYRMSVISLEIRDFVRALGFQKMHVVGHDWGGVILSAMIHQCPEVIDQAVLLNAPFRRFNPLRPRHIYYFNMPGLVERRFKTDPHGLIGEIFDYWTAKPAAFSRLEIVDYIEAFQTQRSFECAMGYYRALRNDMRFLFSSIRSSLPSPGPPQTLIIWGCKDPIMPTCVGKWAHKDIPGSQLELIDDAGHFVHREAPERVNELIVSFFSGS
ncbi:MAG TPA: alpha/beta hydrolase [Myxococcales bacterium]|nr:alpha/beta hydrolase [Myxococcales bacterium]